MCLPMAGALIGAALSIAQMNAQAQSEYEQKEAANRQYTQNRKNAIVAANDKYRSIGNKAVEERHAASTKLFQQRIDNLKKKASAVVAAGEGGVTGLSVAAVMQDKIAQEARQENAIVTNFKYKLGSLYDEADASYHDAVNRINSVQPGSPIPVWEPYTGGLGGDGGAFRNTS